MRIDAFEIYWHFQPVFTLAEVINGEAKVFRSFHIRNVRGNEESSLSLRVEVNGISLQKKAIRQLPLHDEIRAAEIEKNIVNQVILPHRMQPGKYSGRLYIFYGRLDQFYSTEFQVEILGANRIPVDFPRAHLLAAYVKSGETEKNFAATAVETLFSPGGSSNAPAEKALPLLYHALLEKKLLYQPVSTGVHPDCQEISSFPNTLKNGGSCADLSLLFASLMWDIGLSPALLLYENHMCAGCFCDPIPEFPVLSGAGEVAKLIHTGRLILIESTAVCRQKQYPYEMAREEAEAKLKQNPPCVLIHVRHLQRHGLKTVSDIFDSIFECPHCGFENRLSSESQDALCLACHLPLPVSTTPKDLPPASAVHTYCSSVQYGLNSYGACVQKLKNKTEETVDLMDLWQGHRVLTIGRQAFENSEIKAIALPDSISRIEDYAFRGCSLLKHVDLPDSIVFIGTGAFRNSGLQFLHIPGTVKQITRLAFAGCASLSHVRLDEGIETIEEKAFENCSRLLNAEIPSSVCTIAHNAFPPNCKLTLLSPLTRIL